MAWNDSFASYLNSLANNPNLPANSGFLVGRVTHVVQGPFLLGSNNKIPDKYYKDPTSLGEITFQLLSVVQDSTQQDKGNVTAKPFLAAFKQYPLEGEIVYLIPGPATALNTNKGTRDLFYFPAYNLWNASHHNAIPDLGDYSAYVNSQKRNYQDSSDTQQANNLSATGSLNFPLGPNFPEQYGIKSLRQFTGDVTVEGRWGNSIRFGSTTVGNSEENYWSKTGNPGSPITIIRNGQGTQRASKVDYIGWIPTVENINVDPSSIYLTDGQTINIDDLSKFSLRSLETNIPTSQTVAIPIQQQLTSTDTLSAREQDEQIKKFTS